MKLNKTKKAAPVFTHEGARAKKIGAEDQLTRSVMACMLWEDTFYEQGESIAARIASTIPLVTPEAVALIAIEAREQMKLRHVPLLIVREMARITSHRHLVADTLARVIQRPDELSEFLAIYWKDKKQPLSAQVKKGLAQAFTKFDEYALAKYNRDGDIKLRDVLFLSHAKPADKKQEKLWKKLVDGTLEVPDTWEVGLSTGGGKKETFTRLMEEGKLGALALLRNLRNMQEAGIEKSVIKQALKDMNAERVLPFRFITAARYAPNLEPELEAAMFKSLEGRPKLSGKTVLAVDTSGSMEGKVSDKSEISRRDAAAALAMMLREIGDEVDVLAFGSLVGMVRPRRGFALNDEIGSGRFGHGTEIGLAVAAANSLNPDRIIVISDEQSRGNVPDPKAEHSYMINVGTYQNGVGYGGNWVNISGWSEALIDYIIALENED